MLAVGVTACVLVLFAGAIAVAGAVEASHRARAATDLAALAAAAAWPWDGTPADACRRAAEVASANSAELVRCTPAVDGSVTTTVYVLVRWPRSGPGHGTARATARAGPGP